MKPNAFQKILLLIYLFLITVLCIFYTPFRIYVDAYNHTEVYDTIWSGNSNVDLYRISIYLVLSFTTFYILYRHLNKMSALETTIYKRKARTELIIFLAFLGSIFLFIGVILLTNLTNQIRQTNLSEAIKSNKEQNANLLMGIGKKKGNRIDFAKSFFRKWNYLGTDEEIAKVWEDVVKVQDDSTLLYHYLEGSTKDFNTKLTSDGLPILPKGYEPINIVSSYDGIKAHFQPEKIKTIKPVGKFEPSKRHQKSVDLRSLIIDDDSQNSNTTASNKSQLDIITEKIDQQWKERTKQKELAAIPTLSQIGINSVSDLKLFIENNLFTEEDIKKRDEANDLASNINSDQIKKDSLLFYQDVDVKRYVLIYIIVLFGIVYIIRPLLLFIKSIFVELK